MIRRVSETATESADSLIELKETVNNFRAAFPDSELTIDEVYFIEDRSFCRFTFTGTNTGQGDMPPTGQAVSVSGAAISRYADGKMVGGLVYYDTLGFMIQLGIIEMPEAPEMAAGA